MVESKHHDSAVPDKRLHMHHAPLPVFVTASVAAALYKREGKRPHWQPVGSRGRSIANLNLKKLEGRPLTTYPPGRHRPPASASHPACPRSNRPPGPPGASREPSGAPQGTLRSGRRQGWTQSLDAPAGPHSARPAPPPRQAQIRRLRPLDEPAVGAAPAPASIDGTRCPRPG